MEWLPDSESWLLAGPVLARMLALAFTLPVLSSRWLPGRYRIALAIVLTLAILPLVAISHDSAGSPVAFGPAWIMALINEGLIGASMGLAARVVLEAARLAGLMIESMCGLSFGVAAGIDPAHSESGGPVLSQLFWWTSLAVFIASGGVREMLGGIIHSFYLWPAGTASFDRGFLDFLVAALGNGFEFGLRAALPGIVALLVATAVLAMTQRNCPQLGGLQVGLGLKSASGLVVTSLLLLSAPWVVRHGMDITWQQLQEWVVHTPVSALPG